MSNRDVAVFVCGRMTRQTREAFVQLVRQLPSWLDVALVGYAPDPSEHRARCRVGLRSHPHRLYDAADLLALDLPGLDTIDPATFQLIPDHAELIQMRFAHDQPHYDRYWFVEDDVRFGGHWASVFDHFRDSPAGLLGTTMRTLESDPDWHWWGSLDAPVDVADEDLVSAFLPFGALRREAIDAIVDGYRAGWQGHFELVWPTLVRRAGLSIQDVGGSSSFVAPGDENRFYTNTGVGKLAPGTFVWRPYHEDYDRSSGKLWHPVRNVLGGVDASRAAAAARSSAPQEMS